MQKFTSTEQLPRSVCTDLSCSEPCWWDGINSFCLAWSVISLECLLRLGAAESWLGCQKKEMQKGNKTGNTNIMQTEDCKAKSWRRKGTTAKQPSWWKQKRTDEWREICKSSQHFLLVMLKFYIMRQKILHTDSTWTCTTCLNALNRLVFVLSEKTSQFQN